jgi:hypothetical protein
VGVQVAAVSIALGMLLPWLVGGCWVDPPAPGSLGLYLHLLREHSLEKSRELLLVVVVVVPSLSWLSLLLGLNVYLHWQLLVSLRLCFARYLKVARRSQAPEALAHADAYELGGGGAGAAAGAAEEALLQPDFQTPPALVEATTTLLERISRPLSLLSLLRLLSLSIFASEVFAATWSESWRCGVGYQGAPMQPYR